MKLKSKLYKIVVKPAMVYGSECWALHKQEEKGLHTTEMKTLRWSPGKTRKDRIKNATSCVKKPSQSEKSFLSYAHGQTNYSKHIHTVNSKCVYNQTCNPYITCDFLLSFIPNNI